MSFFQQMNFPRAVILGSVVASLGLGYFAWSLTQRKNDLVDQDERRVPALVKEIQGLSLELNQLQSRFDSDIFVKADNPQSYVRAISLEPNVRTGEMDVDTKDDPFTKGIVDRKITIKPIDKQRKYSRREISNFLYRLEEKSRRLRITHVKIEPQGKAKPEEIHNDAWTFDAVITSRESTGEAAPTSKG